MTLYLHHTLRTCPRLETDNTGDRSGNVLSSLWTLSINSNVPDRLRDIPTSS